MNYTVPPLHSPLRGSSTRLALLGREEGLGAGLAGLPENSVKVGQIYGGPSVRLGEVEKRSEHLLAACFPSRVREGGVYRGYTPPLSRTRHFEIDANIIS